MENSSQLELSDSEKLEPIIQVSKSDIKKNQKKHDKQSAEDITIAVNYLSKIIKELKLKGNGKPPSRNAILTEMKRIGFDISTTTLWRYRGKINKVKSAVRDLLEEGTYSAYFDHNMELLDYKDHTLNSKEISELNKQRHNLDSSGKTLHILRFT